jgi:hypothetical protein
LIAYCSLSHNIILRGPKETETGKLHRESDMHLNKIITTSKTLHTEKEISGKKSEIELIKKTTTYLILT